MISLMRSTHRSVDYNKRLKSHTEADDGLGVPIEQQIFQRFYRLKRSSKIEATGLGLAFVAAVAALHGSQLTVEDNDPGLRILMNFDAVRACDVSETRIAAGELAILPGSRSVSGNQQVCSGS